MTTAEISCSARTHEFTSSVLLADSDYTKWHQVFVKDITPEMFAEIVEESERENPYQGNARII